MTEWPFQENILYNRKLEIHQAYGGQEQGGISTPKCEPGVFLFTGHGADKHGYADKFLADGTFRFTGEGQVGNMKMAKGNKAIRDHSANGKDLLVFRKSRSRAPVEFIGNFACAGWEVERQNDKNGAERDAIVFTLVRLSNVIAAADALHAHGNTTLNLDDLRTAAYQAQTTANGELSKATRTIYERSRDVREYVLARAAGKCENCEVDAPFITKTGRPYLEPHHIRRLSDGGLDHPAHVAAICPNCHRRAHYGVDAQKINLSLANRVGQLELALVT